MGRPTPGRGDVPPRLLAFLYTRLDGLRDKPLGEALAALTPGMGPRARLAVLLGAIEMMTDIARDNPSGPVLAFDAVLPDDDEAEYWARVGMATLIGMRGTPVAEEVTPDPLLSA
jgi:hypothetical protein